MMNIAVGKNHRFIPNGFLIGAVLVLLLIPTGCENISSGGEEISADPPITTAPAAPTGHSAGDGMHIAFRRDTLTKPISSRKPWKDELQGKNEA